MTEQAWLSAIDPMPMIEFLNHPASNRRMSLFYYLCCNRFDRLLVYAGTRYVVGRLEKNADACHVVNDWDTVLTNAETGNELALEPMRQESSTDEEYLRLHAAGAVLSIAIASHPKSTDEDVIGYQRAAIADMLLCAFLLKLDKIPHESSPWRGQRDPEEAALYASFLRDIFGNPFRPVTINPSWLNTSVHSLANGIYNDKAFDRLPILADALQDAGCDNEDILNHCRQPGEHVRGCWVVDLLLNKS